MRLVTFEVKGRLRVGVLLDASGWIVDVRAAARRLGHGGRQPSPLAQVGDMVALLQLDGPDFEVTGQMIADVVRRLEEEGPAAVRGIAYMRPQVRLHAPVPRPTKFLFCGLNYSDHAAEGGRPLPAYPSLFTKFATCVSGPGEAIAKPANVDELDYEGELAFVVGKRGRHVSQRQAMDYIAGYTVINDITAREFSRDPGRRLLGKNFDGFGAMGPALVTRAEIPDPGRLAIRTYVNGELRQDSSTRNLIFTIPELVAYLSRHWTIEPGDVVATGTPAGVGAFMDPPRFLKRGDQVKVEIEGIGALENRIVAEQRRG